MAKQRVGRPPGPAPDPAERRAQLLEAAKRTIRHVGPGASMDDIATEAQLSKPVIYAAFGDKSGLASALLESVTAELTPLILAPLAAADEPRTVVRTAIDAFVAFIEREPELYRYIAGGSKGSSQGAVGHRMVAGVGDQLAVVLQGALARVGGDARAAEPWAYAVLGSVFMAAEWWLERRSLTRDELVSMLSDLVWGGLGGAGLERLDGPIAGPPP